MNFLNDTMKLWGLNLGKDKIKNKISKKILEISIAIHIPILFVLLIILLLKISFNQSPIAICVRSENRIPTWSALIIVDIFRADPSLNDP